MKGEKGMKFIKGSNKYIKFVNVYSVDNHYYINVFFNEKPFNYSQYSIPESKGFIFTFDSDDEVLIGLYNEWDCYEITITKHGPRTYNIWYLDPSNTTYLEGYSTVSDDE